MDNIALERQYPTPYANSTLLPLLLMSLAVQKHTPDTTSLFDDEYDYIIVGAGSAGSALAGRLSEKSCVSVLLLEAGKSPPRLTDVPGISRSFIQSDLDWDYRTAPQKHTGAGLINRELSWRSGKTIGGSSTINGFLHVRGHRENYNDWARMGAKGWSYADVLPYFKKLEGNRMHLDPVYHGFHGPVTVERQGYISEMKDPIEEAGRMFGFPLVDVNGPTQLGLFDIQTTMRNGQRCSAAKAYLVPAEDRYNLDIVAKAFVKKVLIENGRAVGVLFDFSGYEYEVRARREVILSAGTVNSAQLLMLSGVGPREHLEEMGIPVVADLPVGLNLHDHVGTILGFELSDNILPISEKLADPDNIRRYIRNRDGPLSSSSAMAATTFETNDWNTSPYITLHQSDAIPNHEINFMEGSIRAAITQWNIGPEVYEQVFRPYENSTMLWCLIELLTSKSRGFVKLRSSNPYDSPIIDPKYFENKEDIPQIVQGMKLCMSIMTSPPVRRTGARPFATLYPGCEHLVYDMDEYFACQARSVAIALSHSVGTVKMGDPRDPTTVVDPKLRVKGIRGLRVVDLSIIPVVPTGNTNVPAIMIGEKAADIIKKTIKCYNNI